MKKLIGVSLIFVLFAVFLATLLFVPQLAGAIECVKSNTFVGTCNEYNEYARACGPYLKKNDIHCGGLTGTSIYGCSLPLTSEEFTPYPNSLKYHRDGKNWCAVENYAYMATIVDSESAELLFIPDPKGCHSADCVAEAKSFNKDTIAHEYEHQDMIRKIIADFNRRYVQVSVSSCDGTGSPAKTKKEAKQKLQTSAAQFALARSNELERRIFSEPPSKALKCDKCKCKGFKVDQPSGVGRISGVICSELDKPFKLNWEAADVGLVGVQTFKPSGNGRGTYSFSGYLKAGGVTNQGSGNFRIEGVDKGTPVIQTDAGEWVQITKAGIVYIHRYVGEPETLVLEPATNECR